ncbi:MAG: hypothetical protein EP301_00345 [Gammaproteobacteria bacterium]|nr:MAG: hypothetical protein EP301_00345 [Gammaproteobacteria bacterium]
MRSLKTRGDPQKDETPSPEVLASTLAGGEGLGNLEEDLEKVRQILFGTQLTALEERCRLLDKDLRWLIGEEIAAVERQVKNEIDAIKDRINAEERKRESIDGDLLAKLGTLTTDMGTKITSVREKVEHVERALTDQMLSQSDLLNEAIVKRHSENQAELNRALHDLQAAKADRETLADLLMGVAKRLKNEDEDEDDSGN